MRLRPRHFLVVGLIATLANAAFTCRAFVAPDENLALSPAQWREDLRYLARTLPEKHASAFHFTPKPKFEAAVADLDRQLDHLDPDAAWVGMSKIVALVGDAHTYLQSPKDRANFPIAFARFGSDYRVVAVAAGMEKALGARVIKVQDLPVSQVAEILYQSFSQDESSELSEKYLADSLSIGAQLHGAGIISDRSSVQYMIAGDGGEFTIQVRAMPAGQSTGALVLAAKQRPPSRQHPEERFWCDYSAESKAVFCNVRAMRDLKDPSRVMLALISKSHPDKLVIDLRQNFGGDFNEGLKYLVEPVRDLPAINRKGHLFVLIGPNTFSAAMSNATHFRYRTAAILVGRTIGEKPNSYQEPRSFVLPNSHLTVRYSTKFYKFVESGENVVRPDHEVVTTWEDYMAGRDSALEWALHYRPADSQ